MRERQHATICSISGVVDASDSCFWGCGGSCVSTCATHRLEWTGEARDTFALCLGMFVDNRRAEAEATMKEEQETTRKKEEEKQAMIGRDRRREEKGREGIKRN